MEGHQERKEYPSTDAEYFEALALNIFRAGLDWRMIRKKWPAICRAFDNFEIEKVARYNSNDVDRLMADKNIIRNRRKIEAIVHNAKAILAVVKEFGSVAAYVRTLDELGWEALVKDMIKRFKHLGTNSALHFLHSVGEDVPRTPECRK
jgi:DNA-3-methyladenine glycosylase I